MDRPGPRFTFITPILPMSSSPTCSTAATPNGEGNSNDYDVQRQTNVLRWQAFGLDFNPSHPRGASPRNSDESRSSSYRVHDFNVTARADAPPGGRGGGAEEGGGDRMGGTVFRESVGHARALCNDVVTPLRHSPRSHTHSRPSSGASASHLLLSGAVHHAIPSYHALLAEDNAYSAKVASSMPWFSSSSAAGGKKSVATSRAAQQPAQGVWTASWNVSKTDSNSGDVSAPTLDLTLPSKAPTGCAETGAVQQQNQPPREGGSLAPDAPSQQPGTNPLLRNLHSLSERVASAAELQRCGPPRKPSAGAGGGGGGGRQAFFRKGQKTKKGEATSDEHGDKRQSDKADDDHNDGKRSAGADADDAEMPNDSTSNNKRARTKATSAKTKKKVTAAKTSERLHPWQAHGSAQETSASQTHGKRTLLPFYGSLRGAGGGADVGGAGDCANGVLPSSAAGIVPPVSAVAYESLYDTHFLFQDVQAALNDPDRIQAPPLFVGFSTSSSTGLYSNFSISSVWAGKMHMAPHIDPRTAHHCVDSFVIRWREKVYVLPTHVAVPFLVSVFETLVGVEVITFHAPALMLVILSFLDGKPFTTHCVSDVRVMAWMVTSAPQTQGGKASGVGGLAASALAAASLSERQSPTLHSATAHVESQSVRRGGAGMDEFCNVNTLFATHLNKQVCAPLPSQTLANASTEEATAHLQALVNQVYYLSPLYRTLYGQLGTRGLLQPFIRQEKGVALLLATMKREGMLVDMEAVRQFQRLCVSDMHTWREKAEALVPGLMPGFNLQSADQCRRAIYEELQLGRYLLEARDMREAERGAGGAGSVSTLVASAPSLSVTKTGKLSTAEETLRHLARHHPFPLYLLRYRKSAKLLQTYVEGMMKSYAIPCVLAGKEDHERVEEAQEAEQEVGTADLFCDAMATSLRGHELDHTCGGETAAHARTSHESGLVEDADAVTAARGTVCSDGALPRTRYARVHANFLQEGTDTGRLSCAEPNLQNLPRPTTTALASSAFDVHAEEDAVHGDAGEKEEETVGAIGAADQERAFRRCFIAPPEHVLVSVDYEQIELRVLAHLCADHALVDALTHSVDIHSAIAQQVFKKPTVSSEERSQAKRVVFGVLYGAGPRTLAAQMGVSVERAMQVSAMLRSAYPQIDVYHQRVLQQARADGAVRTLSGRLRSLPDLNSGVMGKRAYAERQAFNTVVQGTAADIMKCAMLSVERDVLHVWPREVRLLSQIHDELVFAVAKEKMGDVVPALVKAMTQATTLLVPLRVAVKFGPTFGDLQLWTVDHDLGIGEV